MSDLRTRIAAAIMREQVWNEKNHLSFAEAAKLLADAVIRELGLRQEWMEHPHSESREFRYVTEWTTND